MSNQIDSLKFDDSQNEKVESSAFVVKKAIYSGALASGFLGESLPEMYYLK